MKKIALHVFFIALALATLSLYTYIGYRLGKSAGQHEGWRIAIENHDFPTGTQIDNMAEVCR